MYDFSELFGVSSKQALKFFFDGLLNEIPDEGKIDRLETLYVASILAHYALTPRGDPRYMSPSGSLYQILDHFVLPGLGSCEGGVEMMQDPEILETAGSHTLLLVGFFRDQMKKSHDLRFYDNLGVSFFDKASKSVKEQKKAHMLWHVAQHFPIWTTTCCNMNRTLREKQYLLKLN